jgi:hypothetical protein
MRGLVLVLPALAVGATVGLVGGSAATASTAAPTTVTITADGTDLSGTVSSTKPLKCADQRTVIVIKQFGTRGGGDDQRFASDGAELEGGVYRWDTAINGTPGHFYAKVKPIDGCNGDTSNTIHAQR